MAEAVLLAAAACASLGGAFLVYRGARLFGACTARAQGRVAGIHESPVAQDGGYAPIVEFEADGKAIRSRALTEKGGRRGRVPYKKGDALEILYNPENPRQFIIPGYDKNVMLLVGAASIAAALVMAGAALLL